jgi:CRP-like cAMP-binding protein
MASSSASEGSSTPAFAPTDHNRLLATLSPDEMSRLEGDLEQLPLAVEDTMFGPNEKIEHVYFPTSAVLSLLATDNEGMIEVGTIGNEGMAGLAVFHGAESSPHRCVCQVAGTSLRVAVKAFRRELPALPHFQDRLLRYSQCFFNDVAQSVACNSLHSVEQRCARWLLMTHDRVGGQTFQLKQSFLSYMLATPRNSVSAAATALAKRGLIRYSRAKIEVRDREGLQAAACACYRITQASYEQLLS